VEVFLWQVGTNEENERSLDARGWAKREKLRGVSVVHFLKNKYFFRRIYEADEAFGAEDFLRQVAQEFLKAVPENLRGKEKFHRSEVVIGVGGVMMVVMRGMVRIGRRKLAGGLTRQIVGEGGKLFRKGGSGNPAAADLEFAERAFDIFQARGGNNICPGQKNMGAGARLFPFKAIVPEAFLPPLGIDDGKLDRERKFAQVGVEGEQLNEVLTVSGSVGLDQHDAAGSGGKLGQGGEQFIPGATANTIAADGGDRLRESAELLGVHPGILVIVDEHMGFHPVLLQGGEERFEECRFA